MAIIHSGEISYYQFDLFDNHPIKHGIFSRKGGVSSSPWNSLNLGGGLGDSRDNIIENRKRIFQTMDLEVNSIFDVWQVHGTRVMKVETPRDLSREAEQADAIVTSKTDISLFMRFADCVPIDHIHKGLRQRFEQSRRSGHMPHRIIPPGARCVERGHHHLAHFFRRRAFLVELTDPLCPFLERISI